MAKTFIGELVLRLKNELSGQAKTAASDFDSSVDKIQRAAQKLNGTTWGGGFEEKIRKLGASTGDIEKLRTSWEKLNDSFSSRDLSKSMQAMEKSNFKTASLSYFADIAANAKTAETNIGAMHSRWKDAMKDMAVYGTSGAVLFGGVNALREGIKANAELQREVFAQDNARITATEQARIAATADQLTTKYPSAGLVNTMEMARSARAMMGDTDRGLAILPDLVKGLVALQSAKGPDAAIKQLENLLRGIDNAGQNQGGQLGIENTRQIIAGMIRAAQIENGDIDVGKFFQFARGGKIAIPGLSTEFLATIQPALSQDMTPEGFGKALSSAYQAFVIGASNLAGKKNLQAQRDLGIREGEGKGHLVNDQLFGSNPYQWVKTVLVPALQKSGVNMGNDTEIAKAVAQLTGNSNASGLLTRMITQQQQTDKLVEQYRNAMGPEAADTAAARDPFVAWKGFTESWKEFATSIKGMPEAVAGLNMLTGGIQRFSTALRDKDGLAQLGLAGATGLGVFAAWKSTTAIWGLVTAGTNLNAAAVALEAAAVSLGGGSAATAAKNAAKSPGGWAGMLGLLGKASPYAAMFLLGGSDAHNKYATASSDEQTNMRASARNYYDRYQAATDYMDRRQQMEGLTTPTHYNPNTPGVMDYFQQSVSQAKQAGQDIQDALSVQANPTVNNAQLRETLALVNAIKAGLQGIGGAVAAAKNTVSSEMRRNFADHGVTP